MTTTSILVAGIVCFALTMLGAVLTVYEFKKLGRASSTRSPPAKASQVAVEAT